MRHTAWLTDGTVTRSVAVTWRIAVTRSIAVTWRITVAWAETAMTSKAHTSHSTMVTWRNTHVHWVDDIGGLIGVNVRIHSFFKKA